MFGNQDQMDMIGQTKPPRHSRRTARRADHDRQHIVAIAAECLLPTIAPLGHMVRHAGKDKASEASHCSELGDRGDGVN